MEKNTIELPSELAQQLLERTYELMNHWHPRCGAADYTCELCEQIAQTNHHSPDHRTDCLGVKLVRVLNDKLYPIP